MIEVDAASSLLNVCFDNTVLLCTMLSTNTSLCYDQ